VLPVFQHAFSSKRHLAPFHHRLRMCELGLADAPPGACVRVLDTERSVCEAAAQARGALRCTQAHM
jgi:nicotinic acid mononucleotide adenylyltransferase